MYRLFAGDRYYPMGGANDLALKSDNLEEIAQRFITLCMNGELTVPLIWAHITQDDDLEIVADLMQGKNYNRFILF